ARSERQRHRRRHADHRRHRAQHGGRRRRLIVLRVGGVSVSPEGPREESQMPKHGKRYNELVKAVDTKQVYEPEAALEMVKKTASAKFDETVDVAVRLGVDPRHGDPV